MYEGSHKKAVRKQRQDFFSCKQYIAHATLAQRIMSDTDESYEVII